MKKTVVIGASPEPSRYSNMTCQMLAEAGIPFVPVGIKQGEIAGEKILDIRSKPMIENVHTVTMYLSPKNQPHWYDYILSLQPNWIIFNPGTENTSFQKMAKDQNIEVEVACTLVLLSSGQY